MHLASINSAEEQRDLQEHIQAYGKCLEVYLVLDFESIDYLTF